MRGRGDICPDIGCGLFCRRLFAINLVSVTSSSADRCVVL